MASRPLNQGTPSGVSNVVRLPTAAPRKVNNVRYAEQRRAAIAAKRASGEPFGYKHPTTRKADADAQTLTETVLTPALLIAAAMFKHLPDEAQREVMAVVKAHAATKPEAARQAEFVMRMQRPLLFGEQWELMNAVDRLRGDFSRGEGR